MKKIFFVLGMLTSLVGAQISVSAAGLQIVTKGYGNDENGHGGLRAFNWTAGTQVALLLKSEEKAIVGLDEKSSKLTTFGDDRETDFTKVKARFSNSPYRFNREETSKDGLALMTTLVSDGIPKKGAKKILIKGELLVSVASKSELRKSKKAELKKGTAIVIGDLQLKITRFEKPGWGDDALEIEIESKVDPKGFKSFKFFNAKGEEIEASRSGSGSMGTFGKMIYTVSYTLKKKTDQIILGAEVWTDLETVKVPLDLEIGAGL